MDNLMFYPERNYKPGYGFTSTTDCSDSLLKRIVNFYAEGKARFKSGYGNSIWQNIDKRKSDIDAILTSGNINIVRDALLNPNQHNLLFGFENAFLQHFSALKSQPERQIAEAPWIHDAFARFAEAIGAVRAGGPEAPFLKVNYDVEDLVLAVENKIGIALSFPNPFTNEFGIITSRGLASVRAFQALYQSFRIDTILDLIRGDGRNVVEIGAGTGRTAYYFCKRLRRNYTIIDLPLSNVAQAFFLGVTLGEDQIALGSEDYDREAHSVRILSADHAFAREERFDLVFNADSLTEMDSGIALEYLRFAFRQANSLISINHEAHAFIVADLASSEGHQLLRFPYWMRKGYVEEVGLRFRSRPERVA